MKLSLKSHRFVGNAYLVLKEEPELPRPVVPDRPWQCRTPGDRVTHILRRSLLGHFLQLSILALDVIKMNWIQLVFQFGSYFK